METVDSLYRHNLTLKRIYEGLLKNLRPKAGNQRQFSEYIYIKKHHDQAVRMIKLIENHLL